jgi:hypothetical protein
MRQVLNVKMARSDYLHRTFWQRLHECPASVRLGHNPIIEHHNNAVVSLGSDQTAYALRAILEQT